MRRPARFAVIIAIPVAILLVLDTASWWIVTSRMMREVAAWQQDRIAAGYTVTSDPALRAGWPLRAELVLPNPALATAPPGTADAAAWQAGALRLVFLPWRPTEVTLVLDGQQTVRLGAAAPIALGIGRLDLLIPLDDGGEVDGFVGTGRRLQIPLPAGTASIDALWLKLTARELHLSLSGLALPGIRLPLSETVDSLDLTAHSTVPIPTQRDPAKAAAAWRDAGGQLVISDLELGWSTLSVQGSAQFGLDPALQPTGNGKARITGYGPAIDALERSGVLTRNVATVMTTLLGLMSHPGANGAPQADLPFTLRDGVVSVGAIPVAKIPRLSVP